MKRHSNIFLSTPGYYLLTKTNLEKLFPVENKLTSNKSDDEAIIPLVNIEEYSLIQFLRFLQRKKTLNLSRNVVIIINGFEDYFWAFHSCVSEATSLFKDFLKGSANYFQIHRLIVLIPVEEIFATLTKTFFIVGDSKVSIESIFGKNNCKFISKYDIYYINPHIFS